MSPKLGNYSIFMKWVILSLFYENLTKTTNFFEGWSLFKSNNLGLALGMVMTFYIIVAKELKWKVSFWD